MSLGILELLDLRGLHYKIKGDEAMITCPNSAAHAGGRDSVESFGINLSGRGGHCFACGYSMRPDTVLRWLAGEDLDELTLEVMAARAKLGQLVQQQDAPLYKEVHEVFFPPGVVWDEDGYRGISLETYRALGAVRVTRGRYTDRIAFPIIVDGKLIGVDARALGDQQPKYLRNKFSTAQVNWLYPYDQVRQMVQDGVNYVLLGEGLFHGVNAYDKGFPGLSYFGAHNFSMNKVRMLLALGVDEVIYFPDKDVAGQKAMHQICPMIEPWLHVTVADVASLQQDDEATAKKGKPVFPDLGDLSAQSIEKSIETRKRYSRTMSIL